MIVVFGCGGDRDRGKRPLMGAAAEAGSPTWSSSRPTTRARRRRRRSSSEIVAGLERPADALVEPDRRRAIAAAVGLARAGDVVVIAGKGHEQGQEIAGVVHPFDDRAAAREALEALA